MSGEKFEQVSEGVVKRKEKRLVGVFIDGTGLDRATRRIQRKVDMAALLRGVTSGLPPLVARYYTIVPHEDDSRQRSYLDAVAKAGFEVIVKRLPPKGVQKQVSVDVHMGADMIAFSLGYNKFSDLDVYRDKSSELPTGIIKTPAAARKALQENLPSSAENLAKEPLEESQPKPIGRRIVTVVCPSKDIVYPIQLAKDVGADTVTADFGKLNVGDVLKSANKWIDLSDSETIWRD